ncbi:hypothetical protein [Actinoplanes palleronii]|uniref:hypothetical protein n=1 Tax=Actinoplanes palleronii TaxID=113570 RepID=UPI00194129A5|nr:hypothetical protein [Actinoplanes palleronii]
MMRTRITSAVLFTAAMLSLAACSDDDKTEAGAATPTSAAAIAPSAAPSSAPVLDPESNPDAGGNQAAGVADKELCTATNTAGEAMKKAIVTLMSANSGTIAPADAKAILADFNKQVTTALGSVVTSKVAVSAKAVADEAAKAAAAADPITAAAEPGFEKAGTDFTAACKAAGVAVNF